MPYDPSHIRSTIDSHKAKHRERVLHQREILIKRAIEEIKQVVDDIANAHSTLVEVVKELE